MEKKSYGYDDQKLLDVRIATETKKLNELVAAFKKLALQLDSDRKAFTEDFPKSLIAYS